MVNNSSKAQKHLDDYRKLCEHEEPFPDIFEFIQSRQLEPSATSVVDLLLIDQFYRFHRRSPLTVEDYLERIPSLQDNRQYQLELIYGEYFARRRSGQECDLGVFLHRFPHLSEQLLLHLSCGAHGEDTEQGSQVSTILKETAKASEKLAAYPDLSAVRFEGYQLLRRIGEGGMGVVFKARDEKLQRIVALKMIRSGKLASPREVERFLAEARAVAKLDHESIIRIYELGHAEAYPYFSMEYIDGPNLGKLASIHPLEPQTACRYIHQASVAIAHAHKHGILHRDLKPSNLLLKGSQIKVADFGLAKLMNGEQLQTLSGQMLGTPCYMSPEQARGDTKLDPTTDVYSLGATLYYLVTGRPPFQSASLYETVRQIQECEPVSARLLNPTIGRDIDTICNKCLQKSPQRRYRSASELADDLHRYLNGQPIHARPINPVQRTLRWCLRNRGVTLLTLLLIAALTAVAAMTIHTAHTKEIAAISEYHSRVEQVRGRLLRRNPGWRSSSLEDLRFASRSIPNRRAEVDLRSLAVEVLAGKDLCVVWNRSTPPGADDSNKTPGQDFPVMHALAFSADGTTLATANGLIHPGVPGAIHLIDAQTGATVSRIELPANAFGDILQVLRTGKKDGVRSLAFSPNGKLLVAGMRFGELMFWDLSQKPAQLLATTKASAPQEIKWIVFSPDSHRCFTATENLLESWTCEEEITRQSSRTFHNRIYGLRYQAGAGELLVQSGGLQVLDPRSLETVARDEATVKAGRLASDQRGHFVAADEQGITVRKLRQLSGGTIRLPSQKLSRESGVNDMSLSTRGQFVACGRKDGSLAVWCVPSKQLIFEDIVGREHCVPVFSPACNLLAANGHNGVVLYQIEGGDVLRYLAADVQAPQAFQISPSQKYLACIFAADAEAEQQKAASVVVWDLVEDQELLSHRLDLKDTSEGYVLQWKADDSAILFGSADGTLHQLNLCNKQVHPIDGVRVRRLSIAESGGRIWSVTGDQLQAHSTSLKAARTVWVNTTGRVLSGKSELDHVVAAGGYCVVGSIDGTARLFDCSGDLPQELVQWPEPKSFVSSGEVTAVALSSVPSVAAMGSMRGLLHVISVPGGETLLEGTLHDAPVTAIAFGDGGKLLATSSADGVLKLWERADDRYRLVIQLTGNPGRIHDLQFADSDTLLVARQNETGIQQWNLSLLREQLLELGIDWQ